MKVDIIITTYRNPSIKMCLESVLQKTKNVEFRIILWCNDASDDIKSFVDNLDDERITPIFLNNNGGSFSSNNNAAAKYGDAEYILLLNDDCFTQRDDWLLHMTKILDTDPNVGVVGALLVYPDKKTLQHCGVFFSQKTNSLPYHMNYRQPLSTMKSFISMPRHYQSVTGACLLARREEYEKVGGMDESYFYCFDDIDLCLRINNKLKKTCVYCPEALLIHDEGISKDGKLNPKFKENIETFRSRCAGMYFNDLEFYLSNPNYMIYKRK